MKTERFLFCIECKQTNTTKYTEIDSVQRRQHILFFYIWMAIVDVEIVEEDSRELEELYWREVEDRDSNNKKEKKTMTRE